MEMSACNIGLVGCGIVGGGVVKLLAKQQDFFNTMLGLPLVLKRVSDIDPSRFDQLPIGNAIRSKNADDIINDPEIQIVIELVGGTTFAKDLVLRALSSGKHVVTANKKLLAEYGPDIFEMAQRNSASVFFEASVGGGMPVIKAIREAMIGNEILSIKTIINGTCNYILTRMERDGLTFDAALREAQTAGFAEADPTLDIGGGDSGHKVAIMASLVTDAYVPFKSIPIEGITGISADDISFAKEMGYRIKLLGVIKTSPDRADVDVRVHPAMLHNHHILASVSNEFNAVLLEGDAVGNMLLYGKGAGQMPTASAVISDIIDVARNIKASSPQRIPMGYYSRGHEIAIRPIDEILSRYYLRFTVMDKPRVLAPIAAALGDHGISIASVLQKECSADDRIPVIILTHMAREKGLQEAVRTIEAMDFIRDKTQIIRIEE
jgi:homoserine dehydrogenase